MAAKTLRSLAVSAFCEDMAMMLAAGIQVDDALSLMRGDSGDGPLYDAASAVLERVQMGEPLAEAVEQCGYFPAYAAQLVAAGEAAGRTESVLKSLAVYYETQDKLEKRLKSCLLYTSSCAFPKKHQGHDGTRPCEPSLRRLEHDGLLVSKAPDKAFWNPRGGRADSAEAGGNRSAKDFP